MWLCHERVNILSGGHRELSPSCKMPEGPWLVPSQENGSLLFKEVCRFLFVYILTSCFAATISPLSSFSISLANFICHYPILWETSSLKSWPIITSPFLCLLSDNVKCLLSIRPHSFLQFPLLRLGSSFSLPSPILIFLWDLLVPFTKFCLHLSQWPQKVLDSDSHMIVSCLCLYNINNLEIVSKGLLYSQALNSFKRYCNLK